MQNSTATPTAVKTAPDPSPADWAAWTDEGTWELGPDPEDAAWWAAQGDADFDGPDGEPDWDSLAGNAATQDALERGLSFA